MYLRSRQTGFTVVELLIVIVVIAILAAISIVAYNGIQQRARDVRRMSDSKQIAKGLIMWSMETGKPFSVMNTGNASVPATGWFDANYGGGSVKEILQTGKYIARDVNDPMKNPTTYPNRWNYMVAACTPDVNDNRRVVMIELERPPTQSIAEQAATMGCDSWQITGYPANYKINHLMMADAR